MITRKKPIRKAGQAAKSGAGGQSRLASAGRSGESTKAKAKTKTKASKAGTAIAGSASASRRSGAAARPGVQRRGGRRTSPERKRLLLRQVAHRCFASAGYHETTVDDICTRAGVSKGAFYWHFEGKQAVFLDILNSWVDEVQREVQQQFTQSLASPGPDTYDAVTKALEREARRGRRIMPLWVEFLAQGGRDEEVRRAVGRFHGRIRDVLSGLLEPFLTPAFALADVQALAGTALAAFIGLLCQELGDPKEADFVGNARRFMAMLELLVRNSNPGAVPE